MVKCSKWPYPWQDAQKASVRPNPTSTEISIPPNGAIDNVIIRKGNIFSILLTAAFVATAYAPASQAFNFGDMMNPGKWMGGKKNYDDYGPGGYGGPGGPYGPGGYGGPGGPYGPGGYGGPGGPYGPGGYGGPGGPAPYGGAPYGPGQVGAPGGYGPPGGYGQTPSVTAPPAPQRSGDQSERIRELQQRIEQLEAEQQPRQPAPSPYRSSNPAYRPYGQ
jgi:hypothetical protein